MEISAAAKKRLSTLVEQHDLSLAPLAAKIGVSQSTLWNFIHGETRNFSKLHSLAKELNISLEWIMHGDKSAPTGIDAHGRLSEHAREQGFQDNDRNILREIALAVADLARSYRDLRGPVIADIAVDLWKKIKNGSLPLASGKNKSTSKPVAAEAQRLAVYEVNKLK